MHYLNQLFPWPMKIIARKAINTYRLAIARNSVNTYRLATWRFRSLPHFIIIGAQRSGTTSLFSYLSQHPQILPCLEKEVHFFDGGVNPNIDNYEKGQKWYRAHFPFKRSVRGNRITGEASPLYIFNPVTPGRISNLLPKVKLIAILRNPTERAISHYFYEKWKNRETLSIMEAFQEEDKRIKAAIQSNNFRDRSFVHYSYKSRGLYKEQIERYLQYFEMDQILIIRSEDLFKESNNTLSIVFDFIGVDKTFKVKDFSPRNVGTSRIKVSPEVYEYLNDYFLPYNHALYQLLGKEFDWR
jgi:Sulfotransferase domain